MALSMAAPAPQASQAPLASLTLAGRLVEVRLPKGGPVRDASLAYIPHKGWNYQVGPSGEILGRWRNASYWAEIGERYQEVKPKLTESTPAWRVKVFVFTRSDILHKGADGVVEQQRLGLETRGLSDALEQIGLFKLMADGEMGGVRQAEVNVDIETEPIRFDDSKESLGQWLRDYVTPRVNGGRFESDDSVDRGPFDSIIVVHPTVDSQETILLDGGFGPPVRLSGYFRSAGEAGGLARDLKAKWDLDLALAGQRLGEPDESSPTLFSEDTWKAISNSQPFDRPRWVARKAGEPRKAGPWSSLGVSPLTRLPALPPTWTAPEGRRAIEVPSQFADFVGSSLPEGGIAEGLRTGVVFSVRSSGDVLADLGWKGKTINEVRLPTKAAPLPVEADGPIALASSINVEAERTSTGFRYTERGAARFGYASFVGSTEAPRAFTNARILKFRARSASEEPVAIHLRSGGKDRAWTFGADLPKLGAEWTDYTIDLGPDAVGVLALGPPEAIANRNQIDAIVVEVEGVQFSNAGTPSPAVAAITPSAGGEHRSRALYAASQAGSPVTEDLAKLLKDPNATVQLNAVVAVSQAPRAADLPTLKALGSNVNVWVAAKAIEGMERLKSPEAQAALREVALQCPFDANRALAARALAPGGDIAPISQLFAAKSWWARASAAQTLSRYGGGQNQVILMAFLLDNDPLVRLQVVRGADSENELVLRRLLWASVNDPSDAVRGASLVRLLASKDAKARTEALRGVRDESRQVRAVVVQTLPSTEDARNTLRIAVTDEEPAIKASALLGFAKLPGPVDPAEVSTAFNDPIPVVQRALLDLVKAKNLAIDRATQARLRASTDPETAKLAREIFPE